jgi:hypothetical protein
MPEGYTLLTGAAEITGLRVRRGRRFAAVARPKARGNAERAGLMRCQAYPPGHVRVSGWRADRADVGGDLTQPPADRAGPVWGLSRAKAGRLASGRRGIRRAGGSPAVAAGAGRFPRRWPQAGSGWRQLRPSPCSNSQPQAWAAEPPAAGDVRADHPVPHGAGGHLSNQLHRTYRRLVHVVGVTTCTNEPDDAAYARRP